MRWSGLVVASAGLLATPALAQATGESAATPTARATAADQPGRDTGRRTYERAYFAAFAPATALDIVDHVPGFTLEAVDPSVRGFGQTAGNVVINGQRPSSKSDTLDTILARIPATRVLRVEIAPGAAFGADFAAKAQVLNLVLTAAGGLSTTLEGDLLHDFAGQLLPSGSVSTLWRHGRSTVNASLTIQNYASSEIGYDRVTSLPDGAETEFRDKLNRIADPTGALAASWAYDDGANKTVHLNARAQLERFRLTQTNSDTLVGTAPQDDRLTERYQTQSYELGGDVTRPFAGGGLKLLGLATRRHRDDTDLEVDGLNTDLPTGERQTLVDELDETLARLTWSRAWPHGWSVEAGGEGVVNRLKSQDDLFDLLPGLVPVREDLPGARATVLEHRGEAFVDAGRALSKRLRVDGALTYEVSRLTVSGDASAQRTLHFLKPKLVLGWKTGPWRAQLSVQRTVAQLQFEDFISTAELTNDRVNGGNPDLVPQRSWETLGTLERPILKDGLGRIELGYTSIGLLQDRVPLADGLDAPGNLGTGREWIGRFRVEAPLVDLIGLTGGRLTVYGSYVGTAVRDPYTGLDRPFSGTTAFIGHAEFRRDLKRVAYGASVVYASSVAFYRLDEIDRNFPPVPFVSAFGEWRPAAGTTVTLKVDNLADIPGTRRRTFFEPSRANPVASEQEFRSRNSHLQPFLSLKRSFG